MPDQDEPSWEDLERAWQRAPPDDLEPTGPTRYQVSKPAKWAAIVAGIEGAMVGTSLIVAGYRNNPLLTLVLGAIGFGGAFAAIHGLTLWTFLGFWNRMEANSRNALGVAYGFGVVPAAIFLVVFGLLVVGMAVWAVGFALSGG